jgi:hypothetical protein
MTKDVQEIFAIEFKRLQGGIVATPNSREDLESFARSNQGSMDLVLMQMAIQFGYKMALENLQEDIMLLDKVSNVVEKF